MSFKFAVQVAEFSRAYFYVLSIGNSILIGIFDVHIDSLVVRRQIGICYNHSVTNLKEKSDRSKALISVEFTASPGE